jgi:hypothetical protein
MTQRACASVWIGICRVRRTAERAPSYEQDLFGVRSDCLIECDYFHKIVFFVLYVCLYISCHQIYICHMFYMTAHYFLTRV